MLDRIASLTVGFDNTSALFASVLLLSVAGLFVTSGLYTSAMEGFARKPFYVHVGVLVLVAVAIQLLGGRTNASFVYSRF